MSSLQVIEDLTVSFLLYFSISLTLLRSAHRILFISCVTTGITGRGRYVLHLLCFIAAKLGRLVPTGNLLENI